MRKLQRLNSATKDSSMDPILFFFFFFKVLETKRGSYWVLRLQIFRVNLFASHKSPCIDSTNITSRFSEAAHK